MSLRESHIAQLNEAIENLQKDIELAEAIQRLSNNSDFKKVVREEYFVNECARLVHLSADPNLAIPMRADTVSMAQAAGHFKRFLSAKIQMSNQAIAEITANKKLISELMNLSEEEDIAYERGEITAEDVANRE